MPSKTRVLCAEAAKIICQTKREIGKVWRITEEAKLTLVRLRNQKLSPE